MRWVLFEKSFDIIGTGSFLPKKIVTNQKLAEQFDIDCEWIKARTGILERRFIEPPEGTSFLATEAAKAAILSAQIDPARIGLVIVATSSPDRLTPSTAATIQSSLGISSAWAFDVSCGCSGFLYGLKMASSILNDSAAEYALIIGAESLSRYLDWNDKKSSVLFGDGAGAVVIAKKKRTNQQKDLFLLKSQSDNDGHLSITSKGSDQDNFRIQMNGREVFRYAVNNISESVEQLMDHLDITQQQVKFLMIHQANERILESVRERLGFLSEQIPKNIQYYGNTAAASIPILLNEVAKNRQLAKGDLLLFSSFGAGFTWASLAYVW